MSASAVITQICETGVHLGDTGVLLLSSHNTNQKKNKSKYHWHISALLLPVLSAPQRGRSSRSWIYIFLSHVFSLTVRLVGRSKSINARKSSVL